MPRRARLVGLLALVLLAGCQTVPLVPAPPLPTTSAPPVPTPGEPASPSPSASPAPAEVTIVGVGDIIMGNTPDLPPDGARAFFDPVRGQLRGDVVSGNVDAAITDATTTGKCKPDSTDCFAFRFPPAYAAVLRAAGFGVVNLANNHSHDYGAAGLADTQAALRAHGVQPTGMPGQIAVVPVRGLRVAVLGFAPYGWAQSLLDIPAAQRLVRTAAAQADLVVVNMHAGGEGAAYTHVRPGDETFLGEDRGDAIAFAHAVIDAGAALVIGHSPHVLRGMEWYKNRLIAYSLGNFAGYYTLGLGGVTSDSAILHVRLRADGTFVSGSVTPLTLAGGGTPEPDPAGTSIQIINSLSSEDLGPSGVRIATSGRITPPPGRLRPS